MKAPDDYVIELSYQNAKGEATRRTVSPIRYLSGGRLLALCLCREEPRQFYLKQCSDVQIKPAAALKAPTTTRSDEAEAYGIF